MRATASPRLALPDALRGIASLAVVFYHLHKSEWAWPELSARLPAVVEAVWARGSLGVPVFFVVSGFAIAHAIGSHRVDRRFVGRFMLRRSIRLDPPYWLSLVVAVTVDAVIAYVGHRPLNLPSAGRVLAHLGYLQSLLGVPPLSVVYWTLCLEVQFYLLLALLAWAGRGWLFLAAGAAAIAWPLLDLPSWSGSFLPTWHAFLLGTALYAISKRRRGARRFAALMALGAIAIALRHTLAGRADDALFTAATLGTSGLLLAAIRTGGIAHWGSWRPLQWLGQISYSLYLLHVPVMWFVLAALTHAPGSHNVGGQAVLLFAAAVCPLVVARIAWRWVEVPSQELARRVSLDSAQRQFAPDTSSP